MEKIVEYKILQGITSDQLQDWVEYNIQQGWQPLGGVSAVYRTSSSGVDFVQAMVKYAKESPTKLSKTRG